MSSILSCKGIMVLGLSGLGVENGKDVGALCFGWAARAPPLDLVFSIPGAADANLGCLISVVSDDRLILHLCRFWHLRS